MLFKIPSNLLGAVLALTPLLAADTLQLKDQASITGNIIAEKNDQVAVDVGYTILMVPRTAITKILAEKAEKPAKSEEKPATGANTTPPASAEIPKSFYYNPGALRQEGTVRELVAKLGEAVVQVRTPGGLGSGFFINEDGYLITNFHVIEGETQISIEVYQQKNGELDRRTYKQVRIVAMNKFGDLALLRIDDKDAPKFSFV